MPRKKTEKTFTGLTLEQWQSSLENIQWAQDEPRFKMMLSVILNQCSLAHQSAAGCTGERAFGRVEGYHMALEVLRSMAKRAEKPPSPLQETFDEPSQNALKDAEPLD